jgi:hypothetical protein
MSDLHVQEKSAKGHGAGVEDSAQRGCQQDPGALEASKGGWGTTWWRKGGWFKSRAARRSRKTAVHQCYMRLVGPDGESEEIPILHIGNRFLVPVKVLEQWLDESED